MDGLLTNDNTMESLIETEIRRGLDFDGITECNILFRVNLHLSRHSSFTTTENRKVLMLITIPYLLQRPA